MDKRIAAAELKQLSDTLGVTTVLNEFTPNVRVKLPMTETLWNSPIEDLALSTRSQNGIFRTGARTVGDVSERIMSEKGLQGVRNLGKKSVSEIKTAILCLAYEKLNESEREAFWYYVVTENGNPYSQYK